jgi:type IV fimbrial biogenesis protein FimT
MLGQKTWRCVLSSFPKIRPSGFSLIELVVGLAVMGIMFGLALPSYTAWMANAQIRNASESILNGIQRARSEAVRRNTNVEFFLPQAANAQTSWVVQFPGNVNPLNRLDSRESSEGSKDVSCATFPAGAARITFDSTGTSLTLNSFDNSPAITQVDLDSISLPATQSRELRVTIGAGGNVRMCDPNIPLVPHNPRACN